MRTGCILRCRTAVFGVSFLLLFLVQGVSFVLYLLATPQDAGQYDFSFFLFCCANK